LLSKRKPRNLKAVANGRALMLRSVWEEDADTPIDVKCAHYVFAAGKENPFCRAQLTERQYRVIFSKHSLVTFSRNCNE
jgi:hypothetical protein